MKSKFTISMLAFCFAAAMACSAHAGEGGCDAAAEADAAPCQAAAADACADCPDCPNCPKCAGDSACAEGKCAGCEHCAAAAKGELCANCPGPEKCPHHETCQAACKCASSGEGSQSKPEGGGEK
jgi:hypothetical protein